MSIPREDKEEIAMMVQAIMCEVAAELCNQIERDMRECITDLLLQLGPMLTRQHAASVGEWMEKFNQYREEQYAKREAQRKPVKGFGG